MKTDINNNEFLFHKVQALLNIDNFNDITISLKKLKETYDHYLENYTEHLIHDFKEFFEHNSKTNLNKLLSKWYKNIDEYAKNTVVKLEIKRLLEYVNNLDTYNEHEIMQNIGFIIVGTYIEDWQENTYVKFMSQFEQIMEEIKSIKNTNKNEQEMVVISEGNKEIKKYISSQEITALGSTLKNNIEDSLEEYGDSISESEKIKILLQLIKKYM